MKIIYLGVAAFVSLVVLNFLFPILSAFIPFLTGAVGWAVGKYHR